MNKLLTALLAGAFALNIGTSAFALDATKAVDSVKTTATKAADKVTAPAAVEPAKVEAPKVAEPAKVEETKAAEPVKADKKVTKKHHAKHSKKVAKAKPTETAPAVTEAPAAQ